MGRLRCLVDAALSRTVLGEAEVLDGIRDVRVGPLDAGLDQGLVQQLSGRADERRALPILLVAGLLADEHDAGRDRAGAEDRLGGVGVQIAALAVRGGAAQSGESGSWRDVAARSLATCHDAPNLSPRKEFRLAGRPHHCFTFGYMNRQGSLLPVRAPRGVAFGRSIRSELEETLTAHGLIDTT